MDWFLDAAGSRSVTSGGAVAYLTRTPPLAARQGSLTPRPHRSEAVGNAFRHTAGPVWVSLSWASELVASDRRCSRVDHVGPGFDPAELTPAGSNLITELESGPADEAPRPAVDSALEAESGRGLLIIQALAPEVEVSLRKHAGTAVSIRLPVPRRPETGDRRPETGDRRPETSIDPPRRRGGVLPAIDEAGPDGFGRESFLRALVVQLSRAVEDQHGPDAAEAAVAQVGTDVGAQ